MQITIPITWKTIGTAVSILCIVISTTAYAVWEFRKDYIEDLKNQISTYAQSHTWKLPETLKNLNKISSKLQLQIIEKDLLEKLKKENQRIAEDNQKLLTKITVTESKVSEQSKEIETLRAELQKNYLQSDQIKLIEGDSAELVKNELTFGLSNILSTSIMGNLNNDQIYLDIGGNKAINWNGKKCLLILKRIEKPHAIFAFTCN